MFIEVNTPTFWVCLFWLYFTFIFSHFVPSPLSYLSVKWSNSTKTVISQTAEFSPYKSHSLTSINFIIVVLFISFIFFLCFSSPWTKPILQLKKSQFSNISHSRISQFEAIAQFLLKLLLNFCSFAHFSCNSKNSLRLLLKSTFFIWFLLNFYSLPFCVGLIALFMTSKQIDPKSSWLLSLHYSYWH